jgi:uncharacterized protein (DUF433 family)
MKPTKTQSSHSKLTREMYGGEPYEYYKLGKYIVASPGVCGGRPTFKYTRIRVQFVLELLAAGWTVDDIAYEYKASRISKAAVREAVNLAVKSFNKNFPKAQRAA